MAKAISWQVELTVQPDLLDEFRALTKEMIRSTALEEGVLIYERFLDENASTVFVYERYASSQNAVSHLRTFNKKFAAAFGRLAKRKRFLVFGTPSNELRTLLASCGATFLSRMGGFPA